MKYQALGNTGVQTSSIALGTATFGVAPIEPEAMELVGRALDLGINHFDCANSYGNQPRFDRPGLPSAAERASAEEILGKALKGRRDKVIVSSKVMERVGAGPNERGLSRLHILNQVESSLRRLGTDYIDVYYMHHPDDGTPLEQTLRTFDDLVHQGKIRYPALSTFNGWRMTDALWISDRLNLNAPVLNQMPYSLEARGAEREVIPAALKFKMGIVAFSPLAGGLFTGQATLDRRISGALRWGGTGFTEAQLDLARQLNEVGAKIDVAPATLALSWVLVQPAIACAVIGPETVAELEKSILAANYEMTPELLEQLSVIGRPNFRLLDF